jgi:hypothetical protein
MDEVIAETGAKVSAEGLDAAALADLEREYRAQPTPERRKLLAHAFVWLDLPDEARALLAPAWGSDLDPDEVMLLLWLDQRAGESARLREIAGQMAAASEREVDAFDWRALMVLLGEGFNPRVSYSGGPEKYSAERRSIAMGCLGFATFMTVQYGLIGAGVDPEGGGIRSVVPNELYRGREYRIGRGGSSPGGASTSTAQTTKPQPR